MVYMLPTNPGAVGCSQLLPFVICAGVLLVLQHRICGDDHQHCVGDWDFRALSFILSVLEVVDVLQDSFTLLVRILHVALESEKVQGMESTTHGLEVVEEFDRLHPGVVKLG